MSLLRSFKLSRDRTVTVANLVDELLRRNGDRVVSVEDSGPYRLAELQAEISSIDAFLRCTVGLQPGQPVATAWARVSMIERLLASLMVMEEP